jgi:hypothetical protein
MQTGACVMAGDRTRPTTTSRTPTASSTSGTGPTRAPARSSAWSRPPTPPMASTERPTAWSPTRPSRCAKGSNVLRSAYGPITGGLGGMLALKRKTLSGSCRFLRAVRRARRLPSAAWTPEVPSKASGRGLDGRSRIAQRAPGRRLGAQSWSASPAASREGCAKGVHAARWYSRTRPPSRSRRRTQPGSSSPTTASPAGGSGASSPSARCGRCSL